MQQKLGNATGKGIRVAVIDSGRDPSWEDPRFLPGVGLVDQGTGLSLERSTDDEDRIGHGTACCDVILGMAPEVEILPIRVFGERLETSPEVISAALEHALTADARVANLSLGTPLASAEETLTRAAQICNQCGLILVSAVPRGPGRILPGMLPHALGVQAGRFENIWDFEYRVSYPAECVAQGYREVRWLGGDTRTTFGASIATPHITAIVALLLEKHPQARLPDIRELLGDLAPAG